MSKKQKRMTLLEKESLKNRVNILKFGDVSKSILCTNNMKLSITINFLLGTGQDISFSVRDLEERDKWLYHKAEGCLSVTHEAFRQGNRRATYWEKQITPYIGPHSYHLSLSTTTNR